MAAPTASIRRALIIAAGRGIRLNTHSQEIPKSLIAVAGQSIIEVNLQNLGRCSIEQVVIVTGYKKEILETRLGNGRKAGVEITYVFNPAWQKKNGVSVLAARNEFPPGEHFLLMMSDHIFDPAMLEAMMRAPVPAGGASLAIDRKVSEVFDLDDAMKVRMQGTTITDIGKTLPDYQAIDCGLFTCSTGIFDALERATVDGDCALSDGCKKLIEAGRFRAVDIGAAFWIDIDTPESLAYAMRRLETGKAV